METSEAKVIPLTDVPGLELLPRRSGRKIATSTVWRWATKGVRGVVLESFRVGGLRVTTQAAVAQFIAKINEHQGKSAPVIFSSRPRIPQTEKQLDAIFDPGPKTNPRSSAHQKGGRMQHPRQK